MTRVYAAFASSDEIINFGSSFVSAGVNLLPRATSLPPGYCTCSITRGLNLPTTALGSISFQCLFLPFFILFVIIEALTIRDETDTSQGLVRFYIGLRECHRYALFLRIEEQKGWVPTRARDVRAVMEKGLMSHRLLVSIWGLPTSPPVRRITWLGWRSCWLVPYRTGEWVDFTHHLHRKYTNPPNI